MALIPQDELAILKIASDVKEVAASAKLEAEKMAIAKLINSSANTGQYVALYNHEISDDMKEILKGQGYTLAKRSSQFCADPETQYIIGWNNNVKYPNSNTEPDNSDTDPQDGEGE